MNSLLAPLRIGPTRLQNRIVSTAHQTTLVKDHLPTAEFIAYHEARAAGGAGLIVLEAAAIHPSGLLTDKTLGLFGPHAVLALARVADAIHAHGTRLFVQLFHGGRELIMAPPRRPALAPSAVPSPRFHVEPRALDPGEIEEIIAGYGRGAAAAAAAGLDGVEISAAHNYLIEEFFAPETNLRNDEWQDGRLFFEAVLRSVRESAPQIAVGVRVSADSAVAASILAVVGEQVDYVSFALGDASTLAGAVGIVPPPPEPQNSILRFADEHPGSLPRIVTSRIVEPSDADALIAAGHADAVGMTRALIADPELPRKLESKPARAIMRCIGCNVCIAHYHAGTTIACAQNPRTGREASFKLPRQSSRSRERIVVVGAGPAGLAATREASQRGHEVVLFEREREVGGQIRLMRDAPGQAELANTLLRNYEETLNLPQVSLRLGCVGTAAAIGELDPGLVVVATGAAPYRPPLPGYGGTVIEAWDVLRGARPRGAVLIADWGGDPTGLDCAEVLAASGCKVTLAVAGMTIGESLHAYRRARYLERIYKAGIVVRHHVRITELHAQGAILENIFDRSARELVAADTVVLAQGRIPAPTPAGELRELGIETTRVGDCESPRSLEEGILEGTTTVAAWSERDLDLGEH